MTRARRKYGKFDKARDRLVKEILNGDWYGASTDKLSQQLCLYAGTTKEKYTAWNPLDGDARDMGLYYLTQLTCKNLYVTMTLPSGRKERWRGVRNIKIGRPISKKRAEEDPEARARDGIWMCFMDLRGQDADKIAGYYVGRSRDSQKAVKVVGAVRRVLARYDPTTRVRDVWDEILAEIDRSL